MTIRKVKLPYRFKISVLREMKSIADYLGVSRARVATMALDAGVEAFKRELGDAYANRCEVMNDD